MLNHVKSLTMRLEVIAGTSLQLKMELELFILLLLLDKMMQAVAKEADVPAYVSTRQKSTMLFP